MEDSLAILPSSLGTAKALAAAKKKADPSKYIPAEKGALVLADPKAEECPYTFSDSPAYVRQKKAEEQARRAAELEGKDETRGFLRNVEELAKKQKWEEAFHVLERRTAVPSGLFLVTRAALRWKFFKYAGALRDAEEALKHYASSAKAGPLAAALASFARICLGSEARDKGSCSKEMREAVAAWERAEEHALENHALGHGLFHPRVVERLTEPCQPVEGVEATDGSYTAATGIRIGYVLLRNQRDANAPIVVHFHGSNETAADYRSAALAERYRDLPVHVLVVDYRGYGWSAGSPSLATFLRDAEPFAEKLPEILVQHDFAWPYPGGLIISGRSLGSQVAIHLAAMFPTLFRALILDSALASSATGDRLGRGAERGAALALWRQELEKANLEVLQPISSEMWSLGALDKIRSYEGQLLVLHGLSDDLVPYEGSESLHAAAPTRRKELALIEGANHNNIGHFDAYWAAMRRFSLKVQLDDALPSVGPTLQHLCAVCAEKAVSKCSRCQKVWYCGRAHQAEHWKQHKLTCAGGPPEPKQKVEPEGEACLVALVLAEVRSEADVAALSRSIASAGAQDEPLHSVYVGWHAQSDSLVEQVTEALHESSRAAPELNLVAVEAPKTLGRYQHLEALLAQAIREVPQHAWAAIIDLGVVWSPRFAGAFLPALRRAAPDARVLAVRCARRARLNDATAPVEASGDVAAALAAGAGEVVEDAEPDLGQFVVRFKTLQALIELTPAPVLAADLCGHRLCYKLTHSFGKKVQELNPEEGEWMRCVPPSPPSEEPRSELDVRAGTVLFEGARQAHERLAADAAAAGAPAPDVAPAADRLQTLEGAVAAVGDLRRSIERRVVLRAGETLTAKELRELSMEPMTTFLEEAGLDKVIGVERWAKQKAAEVAEAAARRFAVEVASA